MYLSVCELTHRNDERLYDMMFYPQWSSPVTNQVVTDDPFCHHVSKRSLLSIVHAHTQVVIVPFSVQKVQQVACPDLHGKMKNQTDQSNSSSLV